MHTKTLGRIQRRAIESLANAALANGHNEIAVEIESAVSAPGDAHDIQSSPR